MITYLWASAALLWFIVACIYRKRYLFESEMSNFWQRKAIKHQIDASSLREKHRMVLRTNILIPRTHAE